MLSVEDQIVLSLRRISRAIDVWSRHMLQVYGLTSPQLATLREVMVRHIVSASTLSAALHLTQPTVTGILDRLEQRGLIERKRSKADRRMVMITVTMLGRQLASEAPALLQDGFCHELRQLPTRKQEAILKALEKVAAMLHSPEVNDQGSSTAAFC